MKINMHTHCKPVSLCAQHEAEQLPEIFKNKGIDAIVLTNHCYPEHCDKLSDDLKEQAKLYIDTFYRCKAVGDKVGLKVFFGCEVKLIKEPNKPEFLMYGLSEQDFIDSYPLYNLSQKELFDFCNEHNIIMVQAHPFRTEQGYAPADMKLVHGVEVFNSHSLFDPRFEDSLKLAEQNNLLKTSGSDFHFDVQADASGMIVPDDINDQFMLRDYLRKDECVIYDSKGVFYKSITD